MVYEHAITFSQEVDTIWKRKLNSVSTFFLAVRYSATLVPLVSLLLSKSEVSKQSANRLLEPMQNYSNLRMDMDYSSKCHSTAVVQLIYQ